MPAHAPARPPGGAPPPAVPAPPRPPGRRTVRYLAGLAVLAGLLPAVLAVPPAAAHDVLLATDPADGATLATSPPRIRLTFGEQALRIGTRLQVSGPSGPLTGLPAVDVTGSYVTQALPAGLPAGSYQVIWRVTSADGHPVSGRFGFTVTSGPSAAPGTPSSTTSSAAPAAARPTGTPSRGSLDGPLLAAVLGGVAVLVALVVGMLLAVSRPRTAPLPATPDASTTPTEETR